MLDRIGGVGERIQRSATPHHICEIGGLATMAVAHSIASINQAELRRVKALAADVERTRWREGFEPCSYCGVIANSVDHIPPRSARDGIIASGLMMRYPFIEVPACRECNSLLNLRGGWTLCERRDYIRRQLKRRYRHSLAIPDWTDSELARMSVGMRRYISYGLIVRDFVRQRLAFAMVVR